MSDALADVLLSGDTDTPLRGRQAIVSSTSPVEVTLAGGAVPAAYCARYTPTLNDVVFVVQLGTDLLIIDLVNSGG